MTDPNSIALIDRRILKLKQARELLADPEMYELLRSIFSNLPKAASTADSQGVQLELPRTPRKYRRRGGSLVERTFEHLREYMEPTTAKDLADFMVSKGYRFHAKNRNVAVSKALRQLANAGRIQSRRGDHAKSPIFYWVNVVEKGFSSVTEFREAASPAGEDRPH